MRGSEARRGEFGDRPRLYPLAGMEEPRREWNGWSMYRHGRRSILDRYLITPKQLPVLDYGVTVLDALACAGVVALMALMCQAFCIGFDGYLDAMGW